MRKPSKTNVPYLEHPRAEEQPGAAPRCHCVDVQLGRLNGHPRGGALKHVLVAAGIARHVCRANRRRYRSTVGRTRCRANTPGRWRAWRGTAQHSTTQHMAQPSAPRAHLCWCRPCRTQSSAASWHRCRPTGWSSHTQHSRLQEARLASFKSLQVITSWTQHRSL